MRVIVRIIGIFVLLGTLLLGILWNDYRTFTNQAIVTEAPIILEVVKGSSFQRIMNRLSYQAPAADSIWFKILAHKEGLATQLKAGEYKLAVGLKPLGFLLQLSEGKVMQHSLTFPEGWNFKQLRQVLAENSDLKHTIESTSDKDILQKIGSKESHPEGLFFPDTYHFEKNTTDLVILKKAYFKMQKVLNYQWQNRTSGLPLKTAYQALILASIIEKETGVVYERPVISGVFIRRLKKGMRLQTDPTVIYGMGENYKGNIRKSDLRTLTAYNTYRINGLPPTPIAMPGQHAIHSALHPDKGDSIYFVAKGDGSHQFSATLSQHNNAVNKFQRKRK